jgi:predicted metal-binding membrane protein
VASRTSSTTDLERSCELKVETSHAPHTGFLAASTLLFLVGSAVTVTWCTSMSGMNEMPMPGGWHMSMAWMRMPEQTWAEVAVSFIGMWTAMMIPMMLPCLVPMLLRYRVAVGLTDALAGLTTVAGVGYFLVWTLIGTAIFPLGVGLAAIEMQNSAAARAVPLVTGMIVLATGLLQLTTWKARRLACCRQLSCDETLSADLRTAWSEGVKMGIHCSTCCANLMAVLLVLGIMDLRAMALVTAALTVERLPSSGGHVARGVGVSVIAIGIGLIIRAVGNG